MQIKTIWDYIRAGVGNPRLLRDVVAKAWWQWRQNAAVHVNLSDDLANRRVTAKALGRHVPVLVLENSDTQLWVGVPVAVFNSVVRDLALTEIGKGLAIGTSPRKKRDGMRTIRVEAYRRRAQKHWVSMNTGNALARAIFKDTLLEAGRSSPKVPKLALPDKVAVPDPIRGEADGPVDYVITWVTQDDRDWRAAFAACYAKTSPHDPDGSPDTYGASRFRDNGELRFAMRSVHDNLPWIRTLHIVSNCRPPDWLDLSHPRLNWVTHEEILEAAVLPTFNSHVIETALHRIDGLSERFIYGNDDFMIARPLDPARFFTPSGQSVSFLEQGGMVTGKVKPNAPDYLNASRRSSRLLAKEYGVLATRLHRHSPFALRKSVLFAMETRFHAAIEETRTHRFRDRNDVNLTSFLYHHAAVCSGDAVEGEVHDIFVRNSDLRWRAQLSRAVRDGCDTLCVNDGGDYGGGDWQRGLSKSLRRLFPNAAPWEKDARL